MWSLEVDVDPIDDGVMYITTFSYSILYSTGFLFFFLSVSSFLSLSLLSATWWAFFLRRFSFLVGLHLLILRL